MLATPYYPNLNPVGTPSVFAACTVLVIVALSLPLGTPAAVRRLFTVCASPVLLGMALLGLRRVARTLMN